MLRHSKKSIPGVGPNLTSYCLQTDLAGTILSISSGLFQLIGQQEKDLLGNSLKKIVEADDVKELQAILAKKTINTGTVVPLSVKGKEGSLKLLFNVERKRNGRKTGGVLLWNALMPKESPQVPAKEQEAGWFENFFENSSDLLCLADDKGTFKKVNKTFADLLGYAIAELCDQPAIKFIHPHDVEKSREAGKLLADGGIIKEFENRYCCRNGNIKWLSWSTTMLEKGLFLASARDVTEKKAAEEELKRKSDELNMIVSSLDDIVFEYDTSFRYKKVWCHDETLLNIMPRQFLGKTPLEAFAAMPSIAQLFIEDLKQSLSKREIHYRDFILAIGEEVKYFNSKISPLFDTDGSPKGFTQRITDISEKKKVELAVEVKNEELKIAHQELNDSVESYKVFVMQSSEIIWRGDMAFPISVDMDIDEQVRLFFEDSYVGECNDQMAIFYGFRKASDLIGKRIADFFNANDPVTQEIMRDFVIGGYRLYQRLSMHIDHNGNKRYFLNNLVGVVENARVLRIWVTQNDITEQRKAEKALRESQERYRYQASVLENVFDAVTSSDEEFKIRSWNHAAENMYGVKAEEVMGHTIHEFITLHYHNTTRNEVLKELYRKDSWSGECSFIRPKDGKKILYQSSLTLIRDDKGNVTDIIAINKDITDKRLAEHAIRESEERFRQFADSAPVMIWVSDEHDNTVYVNKCWEDFTGFSKDGVTGDGWSKVVYPDDIPVAIEKYKNCFENREPLMLEYRLRNRAGEYRWVVDNGVPRLLEDGTFMGYIGSVMDIHDRKLAEEKIRFQVQVIQDVSDGIISTDLDFRVISFNKAAENMYGISAEEIIGNPIRDLIIHQYLSCSREDALRELYEKDCWEGQMYYDRKDGKRVYMLCSLAFVKNEQGERIGFAGIHRDITERRQSEEALRISEERYRSVVHALGEGIIMHDKNGEIIASNKSAEDILGISAERLIGTYPYDKENSTIHEDGTPFPSGQYPSIITLKTGQSLQNVIMGVQRPDGALIWISVNTEPIYYTRQRIYPDAVVASFVDITQKKAAEIELQRSQQQLREYSDRITNILASITDGFIAVDKDFNILLWNHAVEGITGLKAKDVIGSNIESAFPDFTGTAEYRQHRQSIDRNIAANFEHYIARFNRWLETSVYPFSQGVFIYFRDITERKKQEQLLNLEKKVLEINAQENTSLKTTIDFFLEGLEKIFSGMLCSVLSLDDDKQSIRHLSAPSLPVDYSLAINGIRIGPAVGSCGTAMYKKERVITTDISLDPAWNDFKELADQFNLKACWSFPILNAQNEVLATIATYYREPSKPTEEELMVLERVSNLLRVIIENKNSEVKIRVSNERYLLVTKATNDAIWDWDVATNTLYWGEGFYNLFGYKPGNVDNSFGFWESCLHPEDKSRVVSGLNKFISDNNFQIWEDEYRFKKANGEYALVYDRGFLIFDHAGKITRMVGSVQDVTDKKELERRLLKQELDKHKLVAQAVVNAQEKERAEIGKELHDNVNQILSTAKLYLDLAKAEQDNRLELISRSTENISDAINEIRGISRSLVPPSVGDLGLIESIQDLVENIKATKKLHVEFYYSGAVDTLLDEKRKLMLFRIVQEQVNNVLKHAAAENLVIELIVDGEDIDLTISDDGHGFEPEKVKSKKGVGLSNIASRAELFNGSVNIVSAPGTGCKLKINIPVSNI